MVGRSGRSRPVASYVFRPSIIVLPSVTVRKNVRSSGKSHGKPNLAPVFPIRRFRSIAATSEIVISFITPPGLLCRLFELFELGRNPFFLPTPREIIVVHVDV